jgi:hypothetical protein
MRALVRALRIRGASKLWQGFPKWIRQPERLRTGIVFRRTFSASTRWHASTKGDNFSARDIPRTKSVQDLEIDILNRARGYGISTLDRLLFESSVGNTDNLDGRLLDRRVGNEHFDLWCICLDFQRLRFGDEGVKAIYRGLRNRCGRHFPFAGPQADHIWDAFISTGTRDLAFLRNLCSFEVRSGAPRKNFLVDIVGRLLEGENPSWARETTLRLRGKHQIDRADVFHLFLCACRSDCKTALDKFCGVYAALSRSNLYHDVIEHLFRQNREVEAFFMHKYLISKGDLPQDFEALAPLVKSIAQNGFGLTQFLRELERAGASFEAQARKLYELERARMVGVSSGNLNIVASTTFGRQPRTILTDEFAARAFATSSLSFDLVLGGLRLLGLIAVGPLSVRAIALSVDGPDALLKRFAKLQEADIDTGASTYVRVIKRLAAQRHTTLLAAVLDTDQHADVFDDVTVQKQLLVNYYTSRDWPQINRTLAILNAGETDGKAKERSANFLLQTALLVKDWPGISQIVAKMRRDRQKIYMETVQTMQGLLSPREVKFTKKSRRQPDEIGFLIRLWQDVLESGVYFEPVYWREVIRRLGMLGHWDDLESTVLWVASWYSSHKNYTDCHHDRTRSQRALKQLFSSRQQAAIISWAFLSQSRPSLSTSLTNPHGAIAAQPWVRGIKLLRSLQGFGIPIYEGTVQGALIHRLRILFSVGGHSKLLRNRRLRAWNSTPLDHYLTAFYQAWMKPLGPVEKQHLTRNILKGRRVRPRDAIALRVSKAWETRQQQRAALVQRWRIRRTRVHAADTVLQTEIETEQTEEFVMYRDLFNASWEEYKK